MVSNRIDIEQELKVFDNMPPSARIWLWQAERPMSAEQITQIKRELNQFLPHWNAHNIALKAKGDVVLQRFVVVALDEAGSHAASGCSMDTLTQAIQGISDRVGIDLLGRTHFYCVVQDDIRSIHMNELSKAKANGIIDENTLVFNALVKNKGELYDQWLIPIKDSWHRRFL